MTNISQNLLKKSIAEFIGTFALVFFGCGAIMINAVYPDSIPIVIIPVLFGGAIMISIFALGHISGGHFNPAVSIALALVGKLKLIDMIFYIIVQIIAAVVALLIVMFLLGNEANYAALTLNSNISQTVGFILEVIITFFLVFVIVAITTDDRAPSMLAGFAIGFTIMLGIFLTANLTGGSLNPARALGSMILNSDYTTVAVHVLGPILGGLIAVFTYKIIK